LGKLHILTTSIVKRVVNGKLQLILGIVVLVVSLVLVLAIFGCGDERPIAKPQPMPAPVPTTTNLIIYVDPVNGGDQNTGSEVAPLKTIQAAIDIAQPGSNIILAAGVYLQDVISKRDGLPNAPITIRGPPTAIISGGGKSRIIEINNDYIVLDGFTIDGLHGDIDKASDYRNKLIYALGKETRSGVTGLRILNMTLRNSGGEAIRLRYFAQNNEVAYCTISDCGIYDFKFGGGEDNGEGIYIGTAADQIGDGKNPTVEPDESNNNWIHHNFIDTQGAECVDIKEGSSGNIVEYNTCTGQQNPNTAGLQSRGNGNIFRNNEVYGNIGAGVRLGGDTPTDGINNDVYMNNIHDNQSGGIKFMSKPQGRICSNTMLNNTGGNSVGTYKYLFTPTDKCGE